MNGRERLKQIKHMAATKGTLSTRELAEHFSVSRMTIHRDFKILEQGGLIRCIHGGAVPVNETQSTASYEFCTSCHKPILPHQHYLLREEDRQSVFCCACCGLKAQQQQEPSNTFYATDLISGKQLPAKDAYFLIRSLAAPCCQPSILTFADEMEAMNFRSSFGGVLGRLPEALEFLRTEQTLEQHR